jgi:hypothetical protein
LELIDNMDEEKTEIISLLREIKGEQKQVRRELQRTRKAIVQEILPIANKLRDVVVLGLALVAVGGAFYALDNKKQDELAEKFLTTIVTGGGIVAVGVKMYTDSKERTETTIRLKKRAEKDEVADDDDEDNK